MSQFSITWKPSHALVSSDRKMKRCSVFADPLLPLLTSKIRSIKNIFALATKYVYLGSNGSTIFEYSYRALVRSGHYKAVHEMPVS